MNFNLLYEPIFTTDIGVFSLPELLHRITSEEVESFPKIAAHHATLFHSFICQLSAVVTSKHNGGNLPENADRWREILLKETNGEEKYWNLLSPLNEPAFLQVPLSSKDIEGRNLITSTGGIDLLFATKNHCMKMGEGSDATAESWIYNLIAAQTGSGYGGAGHYGSVRMRAGPTSRPFMGLIPTKGKNLSINVSSWIMRDTKGIIKHRMTNDPEKLDQYAQPSVTWMDGWDGNHGQIDIDKLDPHFIETAKRIKLLSLNSDSTIGCYIAKSSGRRIKVPENFHGDINDPWAPVEITNKDELAEQWIISPKKRRLDYKFIMDLVMDEGRYQKPFLADMDSDEECSLLIDYMGRGDGKTYGHFSRIINMPRQILNAFEKPGVEETVSEMLQFISDMDRVARGSFSLFFYGGCHNARRKSEDVPPILRTKLGHLSENIDRAIDKRFFFHLSRVCDEAKIGSERTMLNAFKEWIAKIIYEETEIAFNGFSVGHGKTIKADAMAAQELYSRTSKMIDDRNAAC
jgi:CRISPR system Cascade subunit CasA